MIEIGSWADVESTLLAQPAGSLMRIPKYWFPHPTYHGLVPILGFPEGQIADFHKPLGRTGRLFAREFHQWYEVHREDFYPWQTVTPHVRAGSATALVTGSAALGATLGAALGQTEKSAIAGAALGVLVAALISNSR